MAEVTVEQIKKELYYATQDGYIEDLSFYLMEDGTLYAQSYKDTGEVDETVVVTISISKSAKTKVV